MCLSPLKNRATVPPAREFSEGGRSWLELCFQDISQPSTITSVQQRLSSHLEDFSLLEKKNLKFPHSHLCSSPPPPQSFPVSGERLPHPPRCSGQRPGGAHDNSLLCSSPTSNSSANPVGSDSKTHPHSEIRTSFLHPIRVQAPPSPSGMLPSLLGFPGKPSCPCLCIRKKELLKEAKRVFSVLPPSPHSFSPLSSFSSFLSLSLLQPRGLYVCSSPLWGCSSPQFFPHN